MEGLGITSERICFGAEGDAAGVKEGRNLRMGGVWDQGGLRFSHMI